MLRAWNSITVCHRAPTLCLQGQLSRWLVKQRNPRAQNPALGIGINVKYSPKAHKKVRQVTLPCIISPLHGHIPMLSQDLVRSLCKSAWIDLCKAPKESWSPSQHLNLLANPAFYSCSVRKRHNMIKSGQNLPWRFKWVCKKGKWGRDALSPSLKATTSYALKQSSDQIKPTRFLCGRNYSAPLVRGSAGQLYTSNLSPFLHQQWPLYSLHPHCLPAVRQLFKDT